MINITFLTTEMYSYYPLRLSPSQDEWNNVEEYD